MESALFLLSDYYGILYQVTQKGTCFELRSSGHYITFTLHYYIYITLHYYIYITLHYTIGAKTPPLERKIHKLTFGRAQTLVVETNNSRLIIFFGSKWGRVDF